MTPQAYKPPEHLEESTRQWCRDVAEVFEIVPHEERLLTACGESWDELQAARAIIAHEGLVTRDRFGQQRPHPAVAIQRDARLAFVRILRELNLDTAPEPPRPPRR